VTIDKADGRAEIILRSLLFGLSALSLGHKIEVQENAVLRKEKELIQTEE